MKKLLFILLWLVLANYVQAQTIEGKLVKQGDKTPLELVTVGLCQAGDSLVLSGTSTDKNGNFSLQNVKKGTYYLLIRNVGFKTQKTEIFEFDGESTKKMNPIELEPSEKAIKEVVIKDKNIRVREELDKTTYFMPDSLLEHTPKVTGVLAEIPNIIYDEFNKKFTVQGKENILILVDNKERDIKYLNQLPPTAIAKVEVQYFPTGKYSEYDCVINVILNRDKIAGYNGQISHYSSLSQKYLYTYNDANLRYSQKSFSINVSGYFQGNGCSYSDWDKTTNFLKQQYYLHETNRSNNTGRDYSFNIDFDWYINKQNTLNLYVNRTPEENYKYSNTGFKTVIDNNLIDTFSTIYSEKYKKTSDVYSLYYRKTFDKADRELTFDGNYYTYTTITEQFYQKPYSSDNTPSTIHKEDTRKSTYYKLNYKDKILENYWISGGASYNLMSYQTNLINGESDEAGTFKNNQYAGYLNLSGKWKKFSFQVESRLNYYSNYQEDSLVSSSKNLKFTTLLRYKTEKMGSFTLNYRHLYNVPSTMNINLFSTSVDGLNRDAATQLDLQPYSSNYLNLSHNWQVKKFSFNTDVYYWTDNKQTSDISYLDAEKYITSTTVNTKNNHTYGIGTSVSYKNDKWTLNAYLKYQQNYHQGIDFLDVPSLNKAQYISNFSAKYAFTSKFAIESWYSYRTPQWVQFQSTSYSSSQYTLGMYYMFSQNCNLSINWYRPFMKDVKQRIELNSNSIQRTSIINREFRTLFFIDFQYSFSKGQQRKINRQVEKE